MPFSAGKRNGLSARLASRKIMEIMQVSKKTYLQFVEYSIFARWDVKRYETAKNFGFEKTYRLSEILKPYKKPVSKQQMIENGWRIISKINFGGELFLRDSNEIETYKGSLNLVPDDAIIYSKINVRHGCIYYHNKNQVPFGVSSEYPTYKFDDKLVNGFFLQKLLRSTEFKKLLNAKTSGISKARVKQDEFLDLEIPLPSLAEQEKLVAAYNQKIQQAEQLALQGNDLEGEIERYFLEQLGIKNRVKSSNNKQGILFVDFYSLQKWGIEFQNSNSNYNRSDYPCLSINQLCKISSGGTPSRSMLSYYINGTIPWVKTGELRNDVLNDTEEKITIEGLKNSSAKVYKKGAIIIAMYGATIGKTAKLGIDASTNQACAVMFDFKEDIIYSDFLWQYLQIQTEDLKSLAYGSAQPNLNAGIIGNYKIPIPDMKLQRNIVKNVQAEKLKIKKIFLNVQSLKQQAQQEFEKAIFSKV